MKAMTLSIEGMHCTGCAETIERVVSAQPGVRSSEVSFTEGRARFLYDPHATDEQSLVNAIRRLGFDVNGQGLPGTGGSTKADK